MSTLRPLFLFHVHLSLSHFIPIIFALLANEYRTGFVLIQQTFQLALSSDDIKNAILTGKIASLLGVEGLVVF